MKAIILEFNERVAPDPDNTYCMSVFFADDKSVDPEGTYKRIEDDETECD